MRNLLAPAALLAVFCGCATPPVGYSPTAPAERLSAAKLPKLLIETADQSNLVDLHVGDSTSPNEKGGPFDPQIDWPETLRQALTLELQRLGWPTTENGAFVGPRLSAVVEHVYARDSAMGKVEAKVKIAVALKEADGRVVWQERLEGGGTGMAWTAMSSGFRVGLNAALNAAIPKLGPLLSADRAWDLLGKGPPAGSATPEPGEQWWKK